MAFDFSLDDDAQAVVELFRGFFAREVPPARVRANEPAGHDPHLWAQLAELGAPGLALPVDAGGAAAPLSTELLVAEALGRSLAPVALVEHLVAAPFVATALDDAAPGLADGTLVAAPALHRADAAGRWRLVPGGLVADLVVGVDGDETVIVRQEPPANGATNLGDLPLADRGSRDGDRIVVGPASLMDAVLDRWRVLVAGVLTGIAQAGLDLGLDYVRERPQFGQLVGSFQAVQHGLADLPGLIDGGRFLAHKAAWCHEREAAGVAADVDLHRMEIADAGLLATMAHLQAAEAAIVTTDRALHYHGGYGFSREYDIQLYFRRARAWAGLLGDPAAERARIADRLWPVGAAETRAAVGGSRPGPAPTTGTAAGAVAGMDFSLEPHHVALRERLRTLIAETVTDELIAEAHASGTIHCAPFLRALGADGILARAMPGAGRDPVDTWLVSSEAEKAGVPFDAGGMTLVFAGVVDAVGSPFLREHVLEGLLSGERLVCFGLTEPDGGSDLAAVRTRARRDGGGWVIDGAKMWTTMAHVADWVFLLTRDDPDAGPYRGYTTFLVPMDTPGITVDPVWTIGTERSNATFYDGVRVGDEWVLGTPGEGWAVLGVMLGFERGMGNTTPLVPLLRRFAGHAATTGQLADPVVRDRLAAIAIESQVAELLTQRTVWTAASGAPAGTEGSITKIFVTEAYQRAARWAQETVGPSGLLGHGETGAAAHGWIDHDVRHAIPQTLQGGTSEINRNNIARRHLGLPRR